MRSLTQRILESADPIALYLEMRSLMQRILESADPIALYLEMRSLTQRILESADPIASRLTAVEMHYAIYRPSNYKRNPLIDQTDRLKRQQSRRTILFPD